jgi:integrase/recombinase XerC
VYLVATVLPTPLYAGARGGESVALDLGDVRASARKGHLVVRYGKSGKYRDVPLLTLACHSRGVIFLTLSIYGTYRGRGEGPDLSNFT